MIDLKIELVDHQNIIYRITGAPKKLKTEVFKELIKGAMDTRNEMIQSMKDSPPTGRQYPSGRKDGTLHTASSPYKPPRPDIGNLIASIIPDVRKREMEIEVGSIITDPPYPRHLEYGSRDGIRLLPRPYALPAFVHQRTNIKRRVMKAIIDSI